MSTARDLSDARAPLKRRVLLAYGIGEAGTGMATAYLLPWAFPPEAVDAEPNHPAGLITAFMVQIQKLGSAASVFLLDLMLSWSGYEASLGEAQPEGGLVMIRMSMGLIPAVLVMLSLWVMRDWNTVRWRLLHR